MRSMRKPLSRHQVPRAGTRTQARNTGTSRRRLAWGAGSPGAAGRRVWVAGFPFWVSRKGSRAWHPPCGSALTVPSPSPTPATLTSSVAPCRLSSSVKRERRVVGTGPVVAAPWGLLPLNPILPPPPPMCWGHGSQCPGRGDPWDLPPVTAHRPLAHPRSLGGVDPAHASPWWHLRDMVLFGCWLPFLSLPHPPFLRSFIFLPRKT